MDVLKSKSWNSLSEGISKWRVLADYESYAKSTNPIYVFDKVKIPLMIIKC